MSDTQILIAGLVIAVVAIDAKNIAQWIAKHLRDKWTV
jgi:hypothetical protein